MVRYFQFNLILVLFRFAVLVLGTLIVLTQASYSQSTEQGVPTWSFAGDQQPSYRTLWEIGEDLSQADCLSWPDAMYENYATLYPDFREFMDAPGIRARWRKSLILASIEDGWSSNFCSYAHMRVQWRDASERFGPEKVVFCGVPAQNLLQEGEIIAQIGTEFMEYGLRGEMVPLVILLVAQIEIDDNIVLNSDVHYLIQLAYDAATPPQGELRDLATPLLAPSAGDLLTKERKTFVEEAFERAGYRAVLETTQAC